MIFAVVVSALLSVGSSKTVPEYSIEKSKYIPDNIITNDFHVPKGLEKAVDFWIDVYSKYDTNQLIIHDTDNYIVYEVIDISDINALPYFNTEIKEEIINSRVIRVEKKYRDALKMIHNNKQNLQDMDPFVVSVSNKFVGINEDKKFLEASEPGRMRVQKGQKAEFKKGLYYSGKYIPSMEKIFKQYKLPVELARLPFVESYFNPNATSYKKASGIWQFMRGTGKEYLKVRYGYDERKDPVISTHAAAKLLRESYAYLYNNWPLAITAYNHGRFGMKKAVESAKTSDLVMLVKKYKGSNFGFATKNFYAEFLAALYIEKNHKAFFDDVNFAKNGNYGVIATVRVMKISELESLLDVDKDDIRLYNPAITQRVFKEDGEIPEGSRIKIPISRFRRLLSRAETVKDIKDYLRFI